MIKSLGIREVWPSSSVVNSANASRCCRGHPPWLWRSRWDSQWSQDVHQEVLWDSPPPHKTPYLNASRCFLPRIQFLLDFSALPCIIRATQEYDKITIHHYAFTVSRTWVYSLHRKRMKLLGRWNILWASCCQSTTFPMTVIEDDILLTLLHS